MLALRSDQRAPEPQAWRREKKARWRGARMRLVRPCEALEAVIRSLGFILNPAEAEIPWAGYCAECPGEAVGVCCIGDGIFFFRAR